MTGSQTYTIFVGTFTDGDSEGIYRGSIDTSSVEFERVGVTSSDNPSFLTIHPTGDYLYAANNVDDGTVTAFEINQATNDLDRLNSASVGDAGPCYSSIDATGRYLLTAQYHGGSVSMIPIMDDGSVGEPIDVVAHEGSSVDPDRQTEAHPHSIVPGPENKFAYAPDLGSDRIAVYRLDLDAGNLSLVENVAVHDGAGPRHLDFHPNGEYAYVINELDSTLIAFKYDPDTGSLTESATVNTAPTAFDGENYPADIHVHPSGQFLYGSNRGHDSITVFNLDEPERPRLIDAISTRGEWPRHFALDPSGDILFVENQHSNNITAFRINDETGRLRFVEQVATIPEPVCLAILS